MLVEQHSSCRNWVMSCWHGCLSGALYIRSSWCQCHPTLSCLIKIWNGFTFQVLWLTQVVVENRPLNDCLPLYEYCIVSFFSLRCCLHDDRSHLVCKIQLWLLAKKNPFMWHQLTIVCLYSAIKWSSLQYIYANNMRMLWRPRGKTKKRMIAVDARETAPAAATQRMYNKYCLPQQCYGNKWFFSWVVLCFLQTLWNYRNVISLWHFC